MSIINLEKHFKIGKLVYFNLDNKIIECACLSELFKYSVEYYNNENLGTFICYKVKVIAIYDIYKNIIYESIQTDLFKDPIKINEILKNLIRKDIKFFKTFIGAFIRNNKLNGIKYNLNYKGAICRFLYNNIKLTINNSMKTFNIYDNEGNCIHKIIYEDFTIFYRNYNDVINYIIHDDHIEIKKGQYPFYHSILLYYNIKNLQIERYNDYINNYINEKRNNNNEITYLAKYDKTYKIKEKFIFNDMNPPFSKPLKKDSIELINYYKKNINNCIKLIKSCLKKGNEVYNNLLLNCKLEIINLK